MSTLAQKVTVKLGVEKKDGGDVIFRRVNLSQHEKYNEDLYYVLKLYSIQTFSGGDLLPMTSHGFRVNFIYVDMDGDKVMIGSSEELLDALKMHEDKGVIKIIAQVEQRDGEEAQRTPSTASRASDAYTQEPKPTAPAPTASVSSTAGVAQDAPPQIQHILESVVAQIASIPAIMHLQVRGSGPARSVPTPPATAPVPPVASAPSAPTAAAAPAEESKPAPVPERPFIHGRHTCDGCLTTPIIGQRFHATNLPDYDLCSGCRYNYKGEEIQFEPVELDRDRAFQDRWHRRYARHGPPHHHRHGPPPPFGPPDHFGPCPPFGPPDHRGPPPPFGPPDHRGPPPHWGPHHGRCGPRGPHRRWGRGGPFGPPAPHAGPSPEEVDMALKEAIRRSLSDLADRAKEKKKATGVKAQGGMAPCEFLRQTYEPVVMEPVKTDAVNDAPVADAKPAARPKTNGETPPESAEPVHMEEVKVDPPVKTDSPPSSPTKMSDTSFEDEAEGNGDIAKLVGSTLDKFAAAIDDFNSEFDRALNEPHAAEPEIEVKPTKGAEIIEAEDASDDELSQGSWVVDDEQFANDEALARAAHVIGSALFQSDMIQSVQSAGNVSALSQSESGSKASHISDGPSLAPSAMSVPTNPGSITHFQMDRWAVQLNELHGMGLDDDGKIVEILERLTAANLGSDCDEEISIERVVDEYYK